MASETKTVYCDTCPHDFECCSQNRGFEVVQPKPLHFDGDGCAEARKEEARASGYSGRGHYHGEKYYAGPCHGAPQ